MKSKILILIILCFPMIIFADDCQNIEKIDFKQLTLSRKSRFSPFYPYVKVGACPGLPNLGVGFRTRNIEKQMGIDININGNLFVPFLHLCPSLKCTALWYKDTTNTSRYIGVGLEGCVFDLEKPVIFPNIEFVWGAERESLRFSQFGINIIPTWCFLYLLTSGEGKKLFG